MYLALVTPDVAAPVGWARGSGRYRRPSVPRAHPVMILHCQSCRVEHPQLHRHRPSKALWPAADRRAMAGGWL